MKYAHKQKIWNIVVIVVCPDRIIICLVVMSNLIFILKNSWVCVIQGQGRVKFDMIKLRKRVTIVYGH
jgi:hypothetical protein